MAENKDKSKNSNAQNGKKKFSPKRKFRINKKLDGKTGIIFIGHEDPNRISRISTSL